MSEERPDPVWQRAADASAGSVPAASRSVAAGRSSAGHSIDARHGIVNFYVHDRPRRDTEPSRLQCSAGPPSMALRCLHAYVRVHRRAC